MSSRRNVSVFMLFALILFWGSPPHVFAQQDQEKKQRFLMDYPKTGVAIDAAGTNLYRGLIYIKVYPMSPDLVTKYGSGPISSDELTPYNRAEHYLPLGKYEVQYSMRTGGELKTFILRDIIVRADHETYLQVEMNGEAKTTIIGGDMTAQQMADMLRQLTQQVAALTQQVTDLKQDVAKLKQK